MSLSNGRTVTRKKQKIDDPPSHEASTGRQRTDVRPEKTEFRCQKTDNSRQRQMTSGYSDTLYSLLCPSVSARCAARSAPTASIFLVSLASTSSIFLFKLVLPASILLCSSCVLSSSLLLSALIWKAVRSCFSFDSSRASRTLCGENHGRLQNHLPFCRIFQMIFQSLYVSGKVN